MQTITAQPVTAHTVEPVSSPGYWIARAGNVRGPYTWAEIERMASQGLLRLDDGCSIDRRQWAALGAFLSQKPAPTPTSSARIDPAHPAANVIAPVELLALQDSLIAEAALRLDIQNPRIQLEPAIPQETVQNIRRHVAVGAERLLVFFHGDARTGEEGFAITVRGVSWRLASQASENPLATAAGLAMLATSGGKRAPHGGAMSFRQMPGRPLTTFEPGDAAHACFGKLQFGSISAACLPECDEATLEALADFLAEAAAIAQRKSPRLGLAEAKLLARRGGERAAVELCRQALAADPTLAGDVLSFVEGGGEALSPYGEELAATCADENAGWYVRPSVGGMSGPHDRAKLLALAGERQLFADDEYLRCGDRQWRLAADLPGALANCFRDGGRATAQAMHAALDALAEAGVAGDIELLCAAVDGRFFAIAQEGPLVISIPANAEAKPRVDRDLWASAIWRLSPSGGSGRPAKLDLSLAGGEFQMTFNAGRGLAAIESCTRKLFVERARAAFENGEYLLAEKMLDQASPGESGEGGELRERMGKRAQIVAVYDGGHPAISTRSLGALRLDSLGLEFASIVPGDATRFRLGYEQLREISPPARGALPEEMAKKIAHSERTTQLLKTGLAFGASALVPGGSLLVNGLMGGKKAEAAPMNRLCVAAAIDGATYRLFFEAAAERRDDLDRAAKEFWVVGNGLRKRFGGSTGEKGSKESGEQVRLLREIRDLLAQLVSEKAAASPGIKSPNGGAVIACPKCSQRLRVASPGAVACAKCGAKLRVAESYFQGETR